MNWASFPFLRLTTALSIGICFHQLYGGSDFACYYLLLFCFIFFGIYLAYTNYNKLIRGKYFEGWLAIMSFVLVGFLSAQLNYSLQKPRFTQEETKNIEQYYATIISKSINTPKTTKYEVQIKTVYINNQWINHNRTAIVYFVSKDHEKLKYGSNILVKGKLDFIKKQSSHHAFDYSKYLQRQGIYMQGFIYTMSLLSAVRIMEIS